MKAVFSGWRLSVAMEAAVNRHGQALAAAILVPATSREIMTRYPDPESMSVKSSTSFSSFNTRALSVVDALQPDAQVPVPEVGLSSPGGLLGLAQPQHVVLSTAYVFVRPGAGTD
jgi:hypothetical protein